MKHAFQYYWCQPVRRAGPHIFTGKPLIGVSFWICDQRKPQIIETTSPFFRSENFRIFSNSIFQAYFEWNNQAYLISFPHKTQPLIAIYKGEIAWWQQFSEFPAQIRVVVPKEKGKI